MCKFISLEEMITETRTYSDYCERYSMKEIKVCPICSVSIAPNFMGHLDNKDYRYLLHICPSCQELFIIKYYFNWQKDMFILNEIYPKHAINKEFEEEIISVSPKFSKIYNQARQAEAYDLEEIAGMGYRKSLEYLIKDYITYKNPEKDLEVKKMMLGKCIRDLVENPKIQSMAKAATWLGNDETHYIRKWANKDVEDLKKLIDLTIYWIMFEIKTTEYEKSMNLNS